MIRLPGWKPPVTASTSRKPEGVPVSSISPVESFSLVDPALDLLTGAEQTPQQRVLLDDLRVVLGVGGGRDFGCQLGDVVPPAGLVDLVALSQRLADAELVDRVRSGVEIVDDLEDQPVLVEVEVAGVQLHLVDHPRQRRLGDQHRSQDRLLGLDVLRRDVGRGRLGHRVSVKAARRRNRGGGDASSSKPEEPVTHARLPCKSRQKEFTLR